MLPKHSRLRVAAMPVAVLRSSPHIAALGKASVSNRHHLRVLFSLFRSRNLLKSLLTFRPVNRRTLKPGAPLWKMLLHALWVAVWPGLSHHLANLIIQNSVRGGVEVQACEGGGEESVSNSAVEIELPMG